MWFTDNSSAEKIQYKEYYLIANKIAKLFELKNELFSPTGRNLLF